MTLFANYVWKIDMWTGLVINSGGPWLKIFIYSKFFTSELSIWSFRRYLSSTNGLGDTGFLLLIILDISWLWWSAWPLRSIFFKFPLLIFFITQLYYPPVTFSRDLWSQSFLEPQFFKLLSAPSAWFFNQ